jgi:hypothetical protein
LLKSWDFSIGSDFPWYLLIRNVGNSLIRAWVIPYTSPLRWQMRDVLFRSS